MSRKMIDYKVEDGKITSIDGYEVGGGGGGSYNVVVQSAKEVFGYNFSTPLEWYNNEGLKPNTAYEVGDQVKMRIEANFNKQVDSNQILVPTTSTISFNNDTTKMQFGDVVIVLTDRNVSFSSNSSTIQDQNYRFTTNAVPTYTVVKAGTTGADTSLRGKSVATTISYMIYTLGVTKATV